MGPFPNAASAGAAVSRAGPPPSAIIFSDLDGTLLDSRTYRFEAALPALEVLRARGIPLVLCSSKTRREIEVYRERLDNHDPFICENGGGICIPRGIFPFPIGAEASGGYLVISLGTPYRDLRVAFHELCRDLGVRARGFGDMSAAEVADLTGLPPGEADLARRREFDEPFVFEDPAEPRADEFLRAIGARGLRWTRGRIHHILGDNDKGRAARILIGFYRRVFPDLTTIALGDALNDLPLLEAVDEPVLVQREDGTYAEGLRRPGLALADGPGPAGWNRAILGRFGT